VNSAFAPLMRRECGLALEPNALTRLRRDQVIRPDNPSFVGAVALPWLQVKRFAFARPLLGRNV